MENIPDSEVGEGVSAASEGDASTAVDLFGELGSLMSRQVRHIYLLTYSRANLELVPTREEFSRLVLDSFQNSDPCLLEMVPFTFIWLSN